MSYAERSPLFPPGPWTRARWLALLALVGPFVIPGMVLVAVPLHQTTMGWGRWHLVVALLIASLVMIVSRALGTLAYWQSPRMPIYPPLLAGLVGGMMSGWLLVDASNIVLDHSPIVTHDVGLLGIQKGPKNSYSMVVTSWRGPHPMLLGARYHDPSWQPGQPLRVVTHAGALGCEYVTSVSALPLPPPPPLDLPY